MVTSLEGAKQERLFNTLRKSVEKHLIFNNAFVDYFVLNVSIRSNIIYANGTKIGYN